MTLDRPHLAELLDAGGAPPDQVARSLADLRRINRWLGGSRVLAKILTGEVRRSGVSRFSLLDVGAASGDLALMVARRFPLCRVVVCDLKRAHLGSRAWPAVAADARALPFPDCSFDFVSVSLLLHHFADKEAVQVLQRLGRIARRAVLINDLERHWLPLWFAQTAGPALGWGLVTRHDAAASIRQAFLVEELGALALAAGFSDFQVRRHRPWFRLSLVARPRWSDAA